ncbi:MAG: hypothetical protein NTU72_12280 [Fimbriimonadales bacterium]|nr:hypothetical protein [Fimbriimonadales bacterium]
MTEAAEREIRSLFESHQEYEQIQERLLADPIIQIALLIKQGNWQEAHHIAQAHEGNPEADYWHGIIHLIEGDDWNANYWFNRSKKTSPRPAAQINRIQKRRIACLDEAHPTCDSTNPIRM